MRMHLRVFDYNMWGEGGKKMAVEVGMLLFHRT